MSNTYNIKNNTVYVIFIFTPIMLFTILVHFFAILYYPVYLFLIKNSKCLTEYIEMFSFDYTKLGDFFIELEDEYWNER